MRRLLFAATAALFAGACSLTTDLGGYATEPAMPAADASTTVEGGAQPEAAVDAATVSPDARFCEKATASQGSRLLWCRDFDDGQPLTPDVQLGIDAQNATCVIDSGDSVSSPASLRSRIEKGAPSCTYARVIKLIQNAPKQVRIGFDVRIGGPGTLDTEGATYFFIGFGPAEVPCSIIFAASSTQAFAFQQLVNSGETYFDLATAPTPGTWARVEVELDQSASNSPAFSMTVNGKPALARTTLAPACTAEVLNLQTGIFCDSAPNAPREVRYDNLLVTALP
jgi:hypothetical protein